MSDKLSAKNTSLKAHEGGGGHKGNTACNDLHSITAKVDRLSLLPNELLELIFGFAHTLDLPSTGPLSKHLLPFHLSGIYRRIRIRSRRKFYRLIARVNDDPSQGGRIQELDARFTLEPSFLESVTQGSMDRFFLQLTNLEVLTLEGHQELQKSLYRCLRTPLSDSAGQNVPFPSVRSLSVESPNHKTPKFPLLQFAPLAETLVTLEISTYIYPYGAFPTADEPHFPNLTALSIEGPYADDTAIASFCSLCPRLSSLRIRAVRADHCHLIPFLPTTLVRLELYSVDSGARTCDHLVSRFTFLRHLALGTGLFSLDLALHLSSLRNLESLELSEGSFDVAQFIPLVSGSSTRLPLLRKLHLDCVLGRLGTRLDAGADSSFIGRWIPEDSQWTAEDWTVPGFDLESDEGFTANGIRGLIEVARKEGIEVTGSILGALDVLDAYLLEFANVAIFRSGRDKDFRHITQLRASHPHLSGRLPPLDLDSLDPTKLKLVKVELPEEEWFRLTLEN